MRHAKLPHSLLTLAVLPMLVLSLVAQAPHREPAPVTVPALFLSDIHLDPYADPAKVRKLRAASEAEWPALLAGPNSPTQKQDAAALQAACPVRGIDTPNVLWLSSLHAIRTDAAHVKFVTISGDLLAHSFDCKFKTLLPAATHADYLSFVEKTIRYVVSSLRATLPGVPIYTALGNNDSGCTDYKLAADHDDFLALTARIVAETVPEPDRGGVLRDFAAGGYYSAPIAALPNTRILVLDDLFLSKNYTTCAGVSDPAPAAAQLAWLTAHLASAREQHQHIWVLGHIPPGVDLYSTARKLTSVCTGGKPTMFLGSEDLAFTLAANADVIRLALFGHTHSDEMRLLTPEVGLTRKPNLSPRPEAASSAAAAERPATLPSSVLGVPVKLTASITPVNGNRPSFTLASIDPATANLVDYTVIMASNPTGIATTWTTEYTYSTAYHQPSFDAAALTHLIADFQADPTAQTPASQSYLRNYFPGDASSLLQFVWLQYACSLNHDSAQAFAACSCANVK